MKITILSVGKTKEKYIKLGIQDFKDRLKRYTKLNLITVKAEKAPDTLSEKELKQVIDKEGDKLLRKLKPSYVIALTLDGKRFTSEAFANKIEKIKTYHDSHIIFIIGGSNGLSKNVINKANMCLSFSDFTFPHQLMKLILLEQIYRSFRINNNEPYHK
ncbi:MAG: 23S rRNA (pseudouridine(1915)-N(3))-methyltransferase RlmH, partial [Candidatus Izimaplasma sp.]|nr:23S rRNA (pseudouridine(1915)-N(3))-methyltransferase RlmH [Candidatus Izimaplasma bacterium]